MIRLKNIIMVLLYGMISWSGYKGYLYFFDYAAPVVTISGIQESAWCNGDLRCNVAANKPVYLSVWVDDAPLVNDVYIVKDKKPYECIIPTVDMANGEHRLKLLCADTSYHGNIASKEMKFYIDNRPLQATFVNDEQLKVLQGRTLRVQFQVNKEIEQAKVYALAESYDCFAVSKEQNIYECYIPISCEEKPNEYLFSVEVCDRVGNKVELDNKFEILTCEFKKQTIHVDSSKIQEQKEQGKAQSEFEDHVMQLVNGSPQEKLWRGAFCAPIEIDKVTCEFGTIRTSQERGRYMHKALDVINKPKSVVWAPQDGVVVVKDRYGLSGNTVVVDHGHGVFSLFYHLEDFADIEVGQKVAQGNPLGTLGKTGYATGYHLHWEMRVRNTPVDPMQWVNETF